MRVKAFRLRSQGELRSTRTVWICHGQCNNSAESKPLSKIVSFGMTGSHTAGWFDSQYDFANLPLVVLVATGLSLVLLPALNAYSRFNERQADRYAWSNIASIQPFVTAMNKLAEQNLSEKNPPRWVELLFHSHPAVGRRIAAAETWGAKHA